MQLGWHAAASATSAEEIPFDKAWPCTGGHFVTFTTQAARNILPKLFKEKGSADIHMGALFNGLHMSRKTKEGTCFVKPPIGTTFGHPSERPVIG